MHADKIKMNMESNPLMANGLIVMHCREFFCRRVKWYPFKRDKRLLRISTIDKRLAEFLIVQLLFVDNLFLKDIAPCR